MRGAILNPIRFFNPTDAPDWITKFPNMNNIIPGEPHIYGVSTTNNFVRNHVGDMFLQFEVNLSDNITLLLYKQNEFNEFVFDSVIVGENITPVGWVSKPIYKYTLSLPDGIYYVKFNNGYQSDFFRITSDVEITEDLIEIKYSNYENKFGCIFGDNYFTSYFIGQLLEGEGDIEISSYIDDDNLPVKLEASPQATATLHLKGFNYSYKRMIERLFSLNQITINGVEYENVEPPNWSPVEGSELGEIVVKLAQKDNDDYYPEGIGEIPANYVIALDYDGEEFADYDGELFEIII